MQVDHIGAMISSLESLSVKYTNEYATKSYHQVNAFFALKFNYLNAYGDLYIRRIYE